MPKNSALFYALNELYDKALKNVDENFFKAFLYFKKENFKEVIKLLEGLKNRDEFASFLLILAYLKEDKNPKAYPLLKNLIHLDLDYELAKKLALLCAEFGFWQEGEHLFEKLLKLNPFDSELWYEYGLMYDFLDDNKSVKLFERAYYHLLDYKNMLNSTQKTPFDLGGDVLSVRLDGGDRDGIYSLEKFIYEKLLVRVAFLYFRLYRYEDALKLFKDLREFNFANADFFYHYALSLEYCGFYEEAKECYLKALSLKVDANYHFDLGKFYLRRGDFSEGLEHYEHRLAFASNSTFSPQHYDLALRAFKKDKNFLKDKKVFIYCEQGYGDTIMFSRALSVLCKLAKEVIFAPQSQLFRLFDVHIKKLKRTCKDYKNLKISSHISQDFDYALPLCSLFYFLGVNGAKRIGTLLTPLVPFKENTDIRAKKKVGFFTFTQSAIRSKSLYFRNMGLAWLMEVLEGFEVELVNFTLGLDFKLPPSVLDKTPDLKDWLDTYEALKDIDLLISIDSAIAHLALALDVPTLVVLGSRFEWRWGKFEKPRNIFWSKAHILRIEDSVLAKEQMRVKLKELLA